MTALLAAVLVGAGLAGTVVALMLRARERERELRELLELPFGEEDLPVEEVTERVAVESGLDAALARFGVGERLGTALARARVPLRPGEVVALTGIGSVVAAVWLFAATGQLLFAIIGVLIVPLAVVAWVRRRAERRRDEFEAQLPTALAIIASSLQAGHTFLRSVQLMVEQSIPPLSEEFEIALAETRLGTPLVEALEHMAQRLTLRDLDIVVQAVRIQQELGGELADLLYTLAEFMREREELRREVRVLTAETRLSAYVLAGLPVLVFLAIQATNPGYFQPMLSGAGLLILGVGLVMVLLGLTLILRMARSVTL